MRTTSLLILLLTSSHFANAAFGAFSTIQFPGSTNTVAAGIDGDTVVGRYWNAAGANHGFIYDGSSFTTLDFPNSASTSLSDIDGTSIVGGYLDDTGSARGLLYENGGFTTINPPDTSPLYRNGSGALGMWGDNIVGFYNTAGTHSAERHGFLFDGSGYATFDNPNGSTNLAADIEGNRIVGFYFAGGKMHGYYYDGTSFNNIDHPLAISHGTVVTGISGRKIVGYYYPVPNISNGFIYEEGAFKTFNVPPALGYKTEIEGIFGNRIVGSYVDSSNRYHGFIAVIPEASTYLLFICGAVSFPFQFRCRRDMKRVIGSMG